MALVMSPEYLIPPSEISGTPEPRVARAHSAIAVICGTPAPLTTRVVQMEPGPMPTLIPSAPRLIKSRAPSKVATLPAIRSTSGSLRLMVPHRFHHAFAVAVRRIHHQHVHFSCHQLLGAFQEVAASIPPPRQRAIGPADLSPRSDTSASSECP